MGISGVFNGKRVGTPHGGTFGYPVVNGEWSAKSINDDEWALRKLAVVRLPSDSDQKWRSNQFHALHDQRVKVVAGIPGNDQGRLSCNSCHKSFDPIDRETPRTTCAACHSKPKWITGLHVLPCSAHHETRDCTNLIPPVYDKARSHLIPEPCL